MGTGFGVPPRGLPAPADRLLLRLICALACRQVREVSGLERVLCDRDPFVLAANHVSRREAVYSDIFENDPHSPWGLRTRVMGFAPVATHAHGELMWRSRRITLILDLKAAYQRLRLRLRNSWIFRSLTADWDERLHRRLAL